MISGLTTPARICVAPLIEVLAPVRDFKSSNVLCAISILPKPSVMISVIPISSEPVMATPRSYPRSFLRSSSSNPPTMMPLTPAFFALSITSCWIKEPPTIILSLCAGRIRSAVSMSSGLFTAIASSPTVSPPTPKMPWIKVAVVSITTPSFSITSITAPSMCACTWIGFGGSLKRT